MDMTAMVTALNDHGFTDESLTTKVRVIQETVWDIEGREPWPFTEDTTVFTFSGSSSVPTNLPDTFRAPLYMRVVGSSQKLRPVGVDELEAIAQGDLTGTGQTLLYYFDGLTPRFWPVPSATTTIWCRFLSWSTEISGSSTEADFRIPKQFHRLIIYGSLWKLYDMEDDPELASRFEQHYENGLGQMRAALQARTQYDESDHIRMLDTDYSDFDC